MRKLLGIIAILALTLTIGSMTASAQTQITLGPSASGSIAFVGSGGNVTISLGTLLGLPANGTDSYVLVQNGTITLNSNLTISQANPITFAYNNGSGGTLIGDLQLVNFFQVNSLGLYNTTLVANLTNLGGTLVNCGTCSFSNPGAGIHDFTIVIQGSGVVTNLFNSNGTVWAHISTGEIVPTPETSTLALFGTGLLALGLLFWRRIGALGQSTAAI